MSLLFYWYCTEYGVRNRLPKSRPTDPTHPGEHSHMLAEPMEQKIPPHVGDALWATPHHVEGGWAKWTLLENAPLPWPARARFK